MNMAVRSIVGTHPGLVRATNEDSFCDRPADRLWAVADGMGGHARGDWASAAIVAELNAAACPDDRARAIGCIADAVTRANGRILAEAQARGTQMGSTVVALRLAGRGYGIAWVGDSRAYLLRRGALRQLSRDHSQVQELVDRGLLHPDDARNHPMSHVLARAVGVDPQLAVDHGEGVVEAGDLFLLCSDGLSGQLSEAEIEEALVRFPVAEAYEQLLRKTLSRGAPDNVTIAIVAVDSVG